MAIAASFQARTGSSVAKPTGLADGDMVVIATNALGTATAVSGFTQLIFQTDGGGGQTTHLTVLYKKSVTAASEPANYTITGGSGTLDVIVGRVSGYDTTTPFGTPVGQAYSGAGSTLASPAYTPGTADEMLCHFLAVWVDSASFAASSGFTLTVARTEGDPALAEYKQLTGQNGTPQSAGSITGAGSLQTCSVSVGIRAAAGGASPQTWTGSTGAVKVQGTSGSFAPGTRTWTGSTGTVRVVGVGGAFTATATWTGSTGTVRTVGTSGSFVAGAATWTGSTGVVRVVGTSGALTPGTTAWAGSIGTVRVVGTSGTFSAAGSPQTWTGSTGVVKVQGTSGTFTPGTATWAASTGTVRIVGTSGAFVAAGGPQTWTGSTGTVRLTATSGAFVPGTKAWVGSMGTARVVGTSGTFQSIATWIGSTGTIRIAGTAGVWAAGAATWQGTPGTIRIVGVPGVWLGGDTLDPDPELVAVALTSRAVVAQQSRVTIALRSRITVER